MNRVSQPNNHSFSTKRSKCLAALATSIAATSYYGVYKGVTALTKNPDVHTDFKNTTNGTELTNSLPAYQRVAIFFGTTLKNGNHLSFSGNDLHNIFYQHKGPNLANQEAVFNKPISVDGSFVNKLEEDETVSPFIFSGAKLSSKIMTRFGFHEMHVSFGKDGQILPPGLFPAPMWQLGKGDWPDAGEIDVELKYDASKSHYYLLYSVHVGDYNHLKWQEPDKQISIPGDVFQPGKSYKITMINSKHGIQILVDDKPVLEICAPPDASLSTYPFKHSELSTEQSNSIGGWMGNNPRGTDCRAVELAVYQPLDMTTYSLDLHADEDQTLRVATSEDFQPYPGLPEKFNGFGTWDHKLYPNYEIWQNAELTASSPFRDYFVVSDNNQTALRISTQSRAENLHYYKEERHTFKNLQLPEVSTLCSDEVKVAYKIYKPHNTICNWQHKPIAAYISFYDEEWQEVKTKTFETRKEIPLWAIGSNQWVTLNTSAVIPAGTKNVQVGIKATSNEKQDENPAVIFLNDIIATTNQIPEDWRKKS